MLLTVVARQCPVLSSIDAHADRLLEPVSRFDDLHLNHEWLLKHELTHQDMANLTATSRQTVTIVLNELRENQLIKFDRKSILIHDIDALE